MNHQHTHGSSHGHFDRIAEDYDHSLPAHVVEHYLRKRVRWIAANCPRGRGLDVGCGTGTLAAALAGEGWEMTGVDPSAGMLEVMRRSAPGVEAVEGDGTSLPFPDASFELTLTVAALHHIADPDAVRATLMEMARVTRPGGRIVVWDHNPRNPYWKRVMAKVPQDDGSERLIGDAEIMAGLRAGGAEVLSCERLGFVPEFTPRRLIGLAAGFERIAERTPGVRKVCAHNVVLAQPGGEGR